MGAGPETGNMTAAIANDNLQDAVFFDEFRQLEEDSAEFMQQGQGQTEMTETPQNAQAQAQGQTAQAQEQAQPQAPTESQPQDSKGFLASAWDGVKECASAYGQSLENNLGIARDQNGDVNWSKTGYNLGAGKRADGTKKGGGDFSVPQQNAQAQQANAKLLDTKAEDAENLLNKLRLMGR